MVECDVGNNLGSIGEAKEGTHEFTLCIGFLFPRDVLRTILMYFAKTVAGLQTPFVPKRLCVRCILEYR